MSTILEAFQQAFIYNNLDHIQDLLKAFKLYVLTNPDYLKLYLSKLNKHLKITLNLTKPQIQTKSRLINQTGGRCKNSTKIQVILQYMPDNKKSEFFQINHWKELKDKLIDDFGHIKVFRCKAHKQFNQLDQPLQTIIKND